MIDDCLAYENEKVRSSAASALSALVGRHYVNNDEPVDELCLPVIEKCVTEVVSSAGESIRIGYAIALGMIVVPLLLSWYIMCGLGEILPKQSVGVWFLGMLPKCVLRKYLKKIMESLTKCATKTDVCAKWVFSRKAAIESVTTIWKIFYTNDGQY